MLGLDPTVMANCAPPRMMKAVQYVILREVAESTRPMDSATTLRFAQNDGSFTPTLGFACGSPPTYDGAALRLNR